jgi:hypothetical protein
MEGYVYGMEEQMKDLRALNDVGNNQVGWIVWKPSMELPMDSSEPVGTKEWRVQYHQMRPSKGPT